MQTVADSEGTHYLLVKQSSDASLVRDPETGAEQYLDNDQLTVVDGESPLITAASAVDPAVRRLLTATHDDRSLGLVVELVDCGPVRRSNCSMATACARVISTGCSQSFGQPASSTRRLHKVDAATTPPISHTKRSTSCAAPKQDVSRRLPARGRPDRPDRCGSPSTGWSSDSFRP